MPKDIEISTGRALRIRKNEWIRLSQTKSPPFYVAIKEPCACIFPGDTGRQKLIISQRNAAPCILMLCWHSFPGLQGDTNSGTPAVNRQVNVQFAEIPFGFQKEHKR